MILQASRAGHLLWETRTLRCALGKGGVVSAAAKREGDGASPMGLWPLREVFYRADRVQRPESALAARAIKPDDGWCDDPDHADYNRLVKLPHPGRCESMWRQDGLYDVVVPLGYNDGEVRRGAGSAIFLHCASATFQPTEGCVAVERALLIDILKVCRPGDAMAIA